MKTRIIVDSTADLTPEFKSRVKTVPLTVRFGDTEYADGVDIDKNTFYEKLTQSDLLPTTSQASPDAFMKEFEEAKTAGEEVLVITLSSKLSGTFQSASIAAADYDNIYIVDSLSAAIGSSILVERAFELLDEDKSAEEIANILNQEKEKVLVLALIDTLEYLKKGGRISKSTAMVGGVLNIKPIVSIDNGIVNIIGKARGSKMGNNMLLEEINKAGGIDFSKPALFGYTGTSNTALLKFIEDSNLISEGKIKTARYETVGSVIGTHAGPGVTAIAFFKN